MPRPVSGEKLVTLCPAAAHRTDELPAKGKAVRPSYSLAAVTEFARFLSCKFQRFSLLHYKSSFIPILWNLHSQFFQENLGNPMLSNILPLLSFNHFYNCAARETAQCGSKGIWREIWDSRCKISLHSQNRLKCSKCKLWRFPEM